MGIIDSILLVCNRRSLHIFTFIIITFSPYSCEYNPDATAFTEVKQVSYEAQPVIDFFEDKDTVYVSGRSDIPFTIKVEGFIIHEVVIKLNSTTLYSGPYYYNGSDSISGDIRFPFPYIKEGEYNLELYASVNSGSGSISDLMNEELFEISRTWTLIYTEDPEPPDCLFFGESDGKLLIKWAASENKTFEKYVLRLDNPYIFTSSSDHEIYDINDTVFIDNKYLGIGITYELFTVAGSRWSKPKTLGKKHIAEGFNIRTDSTFRRIFSWNKTEYYANFGHLEIRVDGEHLTTINDIEDTVWIMEDGLIKSHTYQIMIWPKEETDWFSAYIPRVQREYSMYFNDFIPAGNMTQSYMESPYIFAASPFSYEVQYIYRYDPNTKETISAPVEDWGLLKVSPNGKYLYQYQNSIDPKILVPSSMIITNKPFGCSNIANNGYLCGHRQTSSFVWDILIYDMALRETIDEIPISSKVLGTSLSPDGTFLAYFDVQNRESTLNIRKYNVISQKFEEDTVVIINGSYGGQISFKMDGTDHSFYTVIDNEMVEWDCNNHSSKVIKEIIDGTIAAIDPVNFNLLIFKDDYLYVYEYEGYSLLWKIRMDQELTSGHPNSFKSSAIAMVNSVIYLKNISIDLKDYESYN